MMRTNAQSPRCYTRAQVCEKLQIARASFFDLKRRGQLPCVEECRPRIGRLARYRADLIDRWVANQWQLPHQAARRIPIRMAKAGTVPAKTA